MRSLQTHGATVVGRIDAGYAVLVQFCDLIGEDDTTAAAEYLYMAATTLFEQVMHVLEIFYVPALVGGHCYGVGIFLDGAIYHVLHTAIVAEVYDFHTAGLHDPAHDIDSSIMTVEQGGCRNNTNLMLGSI